MWHELLARLGVPMWVTYLLVPAILIGLCCIWSASAWVVGLFRRE